MGLVVKPAILCDYIFCIIFYLHGSFFSIYDFDSNVATLLNSTVVKDIICDRI